MGYDQNNAGLHLVPRGYKGSRDSFQPYDKYAAIIAEANMKKQSKTTTSEEILKEVELCNFVMFAKKRGEFKQCLCGGKLNYKDKLVVRYHDNNKMQSIEMMGKQCVDCERKMLVKSEVVDHIQKNIIACRKSKDYR